MRTMSLLLILAVMAGPGCKSSIMEAAPLSRDLFAISGRAARDRLILRDILALDLGKVARSEAVWAVVEITLDPESNVPHGRMVPETGPNAKLVVTVFVKGQCKVLAKLTGDSKKEEWAFEWTPLQMMAISAATRGYRPQSLDSGIMIMRIDTASVGEKQFPEFYVLPDKTWVPFAAEAVEQLRQHSDWYDATRVAQNTERLTQTALGDNPLLGMLAFRALAKAGALEPSMLPKALAKSPFPTQAMLLQTILENTKEQDVEGVCAAIKGVIDAATKVEEVEGLMAGATFLPRLNKSAGKVTERVASDVEKRLDQLKGSDEVRKCIERMIVIRKFPPGGDGNTPK